MKATRVYNLTWIAIHVILFLFCMIFIVVKCFGHTFDVHVSTGEEMLMEQKAEERERQKEAIRDYYKDREDNIEEWYQEDDYCDKDLRDKVLEKTKEQEKVDLDSTKKGYVIG